MPITGSVTINGPGANRLSVSGNDAYQVFDISGSASVSIAGLTITEGLANSGGGILLQGSASPQHQQLHADRQRGPRHHAGPGNTAGGGFGGAIEDDSSGALNVTGSTFGANKAIGIGANDSNVGPSYILALGGAIDVNYEATGRRRSVTARLPETRRRRQPRRQCRWRRAEQFQQLWCDDDRHGLHAQRQRGDRSSRR